MRLEPKCEFGPEPVLREGTGGLKNLIVNRLCLLGEIGGKSVQILVAGIERTTVSIYS